MIHPIGSAWSVRPRTIPARCVLFGLLAFACMGAEPPPSLNGRFERVDIARLAGGFRPAFVIESLNTGERWFFNGEQCREPLAPCSTFKIFNTMAGLDAGVLRDEHSVKKWDGSKQFFPSWERDHDLASAIRYSVVWYYQEVAREIGAARMQAYLDKAGYGNRDISGGIDRFWLGNSLKISAEEQVDFLARFYRGQLPFSRTACETTQKILVLNRFENGTFSGKTGSDWKAGEWLLGWFVGHVSRDGEAYVFALNILGEDARGQLARPLAESILREAGLLPPQ